MTKLVVSAAIVALTSFAPATATAPLSCAVRRQSTAIQLNDFLSPAEIVRPPARTPIRGVAVLFAGSDVADKDGTIVGEREVIISRPLRQVADALACAGIASFRYNKRYVTGPATVDRIKFDRMSGADLAADGQTAVAFTRSAPGLNNVPLALVGWSEGTTVAMAVATRVRGVRAVALLAPVVPPLAKNAQGQYARVGRPYLTRFATDGALDAAAIARADRGSGGALAHIFVRMFRGFRPGETINPLLDTNKDKRISFDEADPIIARWYADTPGGGLGMAGSDRALKGVADAFTSNAPNLLLLQGQNDGNVDPEEAIKFGHRADARHRVTVKLYAGLGHSLASTLSALEDRLSPMSEEPLRDLGKWLATKLR